MFTETDTYEYFDPNLGFLRSIDGDEWFVVPLRVFTNGKRLKEVFDTKESAAARLVEYVKSQPRPKKKKHEVWGVPVNDKRRG